MALTTRLGSPYLVLIIWCSSGPVVFKRPSKTKPTKMYESEVYTMDLKKPGSAVPVLTTASLKLLDDNLLVSIEESVIRVATIPEEVGPTMTPSAIST